MEIQSNSNENAKNKLFKQKKTYTPPTLQEKPMTRHFMVCSNPAWKCPPGTSLKQTGSCF